MKFTCPKCSTRYSVGEDRVPPDKTLRFACKVCSGVIRLKRKDPRLKLHSTPFDSTAIFASTADHTQASQRPASYKTPPPPPPEVIIQWFVIVSGNQKGPVPGQDIVEMLRNNQLDRRSYAWRDGMNDWARLGSIQEFSDLANDVGDASWRLVNPVAELNSASPPSHPEFSDDEIVPETLSRTDDLLEGLSPEEQALQREKEAEFAKLYEEHQELERETLSAARELETERKLITAEQEKELTRLRAENLHFEEEEERLRQEKDQLRSDALKEDERTVADLHSEEEDDFSLDKKSLQREQEVSERVGAPPSDDFFEEVLFEDGRVFHETSAAEDEEFARESAEVRADHFDAEEALNLDNDLFERQAEKETRDAQQRLLDEESQATTTEREQPEEPVYQDIKQEEPKDEFFELDEQFQEMQGFDSAISSEEPDEPNLGFVDSPSPSEGSKSELPPQLHGSIDADNIKTSSYFRTSFNSASILSDVNVDTSTAGASEIPPAPEPLPPPGTSRRQEPKESNRYRAKRFYHHRGRRSLHIEPQSDAGD